jgi:tRNA(fMet)-specific endonuclease VapC
MTIRYLLDTNIVSEPLRPEPNAQLLQQLREHENAMAIPVIVWHELRFGAERLPPSLRRTAIERYLAEVVAVTLPILPYDEQAASWHATHRARLVAAGKTAPFADGQIAAIAAVHDLVLVTANTADFADFAIVVENWLRS